jgi:DNA-binding transcriptional regulator YiaG
MKTNTKPSTRHLRDEIVKYVELLKANKVTTTEVATYLGVSYVTVYRWLKGTNHPHPMALKLVRQLADMKGLRLVA